MCKYRKSGLRLVPIFCTWGQEYIYIPIAYKHIEVLLTPKYELYGDIDPLGLFPVRAEP